MTDTELQALFQAADAAGKQAALNAVPTPMFVREEIGPNPGRIYGPVMDGVCGFAWINIKPGTSRAARIAKAKWDAHRAYHGGVDIWVSEYGQSLTRKEAYAQAFAEVLRKAGIDAYAGSRMD